MTALALVASLGACSGGVDGDVQSRQKPTRRENLQLPPPDFRALEPLLTPGLDQLGLRLTRAALVDVRTRKPDPNGRHLALYVEPTTQWSNARFVETIAPVTSIYAPSIFERWPDLVSFDVCQEPSPGVDDRPEPAAVTVVDMMRRGAHALEGGSGDLLALMQAAYRDPGVIRISVSDAVQAEPAFQAVLQEVMKTVPRTTIIPTDLPAGIPYPTPTPG